VRQHRSRVSGQREADDLFSFGRPGRIMEGRRCIIWCQTRSPRVLESGQFSLRVASLSEDNHRGTVASDDTPTKDQDPDATLSTHAVQSKTNLLLDTDMHMNQSKTLQCFRTMASSPVRWLRTVLCYSIPRYDYFAPASDQILALPRAHRVEVSDSCPI